MRERVLAIVNLIAQYFMEEREMVSESDIVEELLAVGFEAAEIDAAFCWMENQSLQPTDPPSMNLPAINHRVFTREESRILDFEARGFLTKLRGLGIVDDDLHEEIVEKAMAMAEDEVSLKEIKTISVLALFARSQNDWRKEFDYLLEDEWSSLYN